MATADEALAAAWRDHQAGRLTEAERAYRALLQAAPDRAEVRYLLGAVCQSQGRLDEAVEEYRRAVSLRPDQVDAWNNLGAALAQLNQLGEAESSLREVLRLRPDNAEAHSNLGIVLRKAGRLDEAVACYHAALRLKPAYPEALNNLGVALSQQGRAEDAAAAYQEALRLRPTYAEAHNNLGLALRDLGRTEPSLASFREAVRLRPAYAEAHKNLGNALAKEGRLEEALASVREAVRLKPNHADSHNSLGNVLTDLGRLDEALDCLREALRLAPESPEALNNLANLHMKAGRLDEALACYDRTLALRPDYPLARANRGQTLLLAGDFDRGWADYESRYRCKEYALPPLLQPLWNGEPLEGKRILLYGEQGLGDTLHFVRYAPLVKARGAAVTVGCPASLIPLLSSCPGIDYLVGETTVGPTYDYYAPLLTLPRILGTRLDSVPAAVPYMSAEPTRVEAWRDRLASAGRFKVGMCWRGNTRNPYNRHRALPPEQFAMLGRVPGVRLVCLQRDATPEELRQAAGQVELFHPGDHWDEDGAFLDTAAVMRNLDLVVSADTSLAHLAGALAVPVWVALPYAPDWRWFLGREDSPWYPTMRLFRQAEWGRWDDVFDRMATALRSLATLRVGTVRVPVSPGELLDKIAILEIKAERIADAGKLANVRRELEGLRQTRDSSLPRSAELDALAAELKVVNEQLWDVEDAIRLCEQAGDFGPRFVELARSVYLTNDRRAALKRRINDVLRSTLVEEKSYEATCS
jgi:tetratricopeptide (TPR) repeat protein